jgi:hypothetical protein
MATGIVSGAMEAGSTRTASAALLAMGAVLLLAYGWRSQRWR